MELLIAPTFQTNFIVLIVPSIISIVELEKCAFIKKRCVMGWLIVIMLQMKKDVVSIGAFSDFILDYSIPENYQSNYKNQRLKT